MLLLPLCKSDHRRGSRNSALNLEQLGDKLNTYLVTKLVTQTQRQKTLSQLNAKWISVNRLPDNNIKLIN